MSKNQQTVKTNEAVQTEVTKVETASATKTYVIPTDGSGAETYIKEQGGVSKAIRTLTAANYSRGEVAKMLNKRYQHVRNVLITPVKKTS